VEDIVESVNYHLLGQGALGPVRALELFVEIDIKMFFQKSGQAPLLDPQKFAGNFRIKKIIDL